MKDKIDKTIQNTHIDIVKKDINTEIRREKYVHICTHIIRNVSQQRTLDKDNNYRKMY